MSVIIGLLIFAVICQFAVSRNQQKQIALINKRLSLQREMMAQVVGLVKDENEPEPLDADTPSGFVS